jgi:integrase/recombinase XerD
MKQQEKRFKVKRFRFETDTGTEIERYMLTDNLLPMFEVNQWIEAKSLRKISTGRNYAEKLSVYLNYLDLCGMEYEAATNKNVTGFIQNLIYGNLNDLKIRSVETVVTYGTLSQYVTVITDFYKWQANNYETKMYFKNKTDNFRARKSFLYGQIYTYDYKYIVDRYLPGLKSGKEYIKWYDASEKQALSSNFLTLRDEAVFRITLEGFRIDETLSIRLGNYNATERVIQPSRSKGRPTVSEGNFNPLRTVALPKGTCDILDRYIATERMTAENTSGIISQYLFINLRKGNEFGRPLSYRNYLAILKGCSERAGLDSKKIRTHSGRSTKAMEYIEHQVLHPEDGLTDAVMLETFGWRSTDSIEPYRNRNNQVIAKAVMKKLHHGGGNGND